uniref:Glycoside hydrolase family 97 protein n=2 Tax=termite gut metagenome TaxID=433724 RepID=S0DDH3_9ZZZZ
MRPILASLLLLCFFGTGKVQAQPHPQVAYFHLGDIELLESPFLEAQLTDLRYIMTLDPDRLLSPFLREAGLTPKAPCYPNWENTGLDGHIGGHYLSALAMMYAATEDEAVRDRLDYMLDELYRAQQAVGTGFIGGTPGSAGLWQEIKSGDIRGEGFDLNGKWVPLYNIHKTYAGLRDAWLHAGSDLARRMLIDFADWMTDITSGLTDEQMQRMLRSEHGGLNETFADVAEITGDGKYLELARRFSHRAILDPLVQGEDRLTGLHANTQIPKVIGFKRVADVSAGDQNDPDGNSGGNLAIEWDNAARFFWDNVVDHRSVAIGGNSVSEHFHPADDFSSMLDHVEGPETCNTYNMLRLTKMLYRTEPEVRFADYYERALYNHILASQQPENGGFVYFTSMRPGHYRVYSQAEESMWCCVGSGMENHTKYGEFIYARSEDALYVNLFIPSRLNWQEKGVTLVQQTRFPDEENISFRVGTGTKGKTAFSLRLRYPSWAKGATVSVNGKPQVVNAEPGSYITIDRKWKDGDEVTLTLPMQVAVEQIPDRKQFYAFTYGPVVLACPMGTEDMDGLYANDGRGAHIAHGRQIPTEEIPMLAGSPESLPGSLHRTDDEQIAFTCGELRFIPFSRLHDSRYAIYFRTIPCAQEVRSPDGLLRVNLELNEGKPAYSVTYNGKTMLESSPLGLDTSIGSFAEGLVPVKNELNPIDETYTLPHAKASRIRYVANELTATYTNRGGDTLQIVFRVSNNDISQTYRINSARHTHCTILKESTGFDFPSHTTTFITPQNRWGEGWMLTKPSYEEEYTLDEPVGTPSKYGVGYTFPALFHIGDDGWVLLSETGVSSRYAGTKLGEGTKEGLYTIAFPEKEENHGVGEATVTARLPLLTSWKTITVGETLKPIVETTSAYDVVEPLYEPSRVFEPGKSTWSWILWQDPSCNYQDQVTFIDLAADLGYEYILIDALWDKQIGYENMPSLIRYAQSKGVDVILWYNSNGSWNDAPQGPHNRMDTAPARHREMEWMRSLGVKGIKVDFFGGDKQATMKLYEDILTDANEYGIAVNFHGTTLPRGWERMYPNHMTSEAALVSENLVFEQYFADREAYTSTILPFTRNAVSGMDFGPVFFNKRFSKDDTYGNFRKTTDAFQVASSVIYQSAIQHMGITPGNLDEQPDHVLDFVKTVPTVWDETRFIDGYPGRYFVVARRHGDKWYIAGSNAEQQTKKLNLSLPWLAGEELSVIYDKEDRTAGLKTDAVDNEGRLVIEMQALGGITITTK